MKKIKFISMLIMLLALSCILTFNVYASGDEKKNVVQEIVSNENTQLFSEETDGNVSFASTTKKTGWFKKGNYVYYRMPNGKLCTSKFIKIGKEYYSFDSKGRRQTGIIPVSKGVYAYFSKTYGNFTNYFMQAVVVKRYENSILVKDQSGSLYRVTLKKVVDIKQREIPKDRIKKNSVVHIVYRGGMKEIYPLEFVNAYKVRLVK